MVTVMEQDEEEESRFLGVRIISKYKIERTTNLINEYFHTKESQNANEDGCDCHPSNMHHCRLRSPSEPKYYKQDRSWQRW